MERENYDQITLSRRLCNYFFASIRGFTSFRIQQNAPGRAFNRGNVGGEITWPKMLSNSKLIADRLKQVNTFANTHSGCHEPHKILASPAILISSANYYQISLQLQ